MSSLLSIQHLGIRLGAQEILRDVSAEIAPGEFIGIFGPNGAGKSTLMKAILGLCPLSTGQIQLFEQAPGQGNCRIGYMPQTRTSLENTALSARALVTAVHRGEKWGLPWPSSTGAKEVNSALELAGALDYADRPFSVLSGGEKKRVALAQALIGQPQLLILDEPLASLDPKNQVLLVQRIQEICQETGTTVLFIAHDVNPLLGVMDRVMYMAGGTAALGSVEAIISSDFLSHLYGVNIHVIKAEGRIFIVNAESNIPETTCCHD